MSANNVIWVMKYQDKFHVFYSGCYDNIPKEPDKNAFGYRFYNKRAMALLYAHDLVKYIENEWSDSNFPAYVEYGVVEIEV